MNKSVNVKDPDNTIIMSCIFRIGAREKKLFIMHISYKFALRCKMYSKCLEINDFVKM